MGRAIVIQGASFASKGFGQVHPLIGLHISGSRNITGSSSYSAYYKGSLVSVSWSVSGDASLSDQSGDTVILTPSASGNIILSASFSYDGVTYTDSLSIVAVMPHLEITPAPQVINGPTLFTASFGGDTDTLVSWSISDSSLASIVDNGNGTCLVTPLVDDNQTSVTLTATSTNGSVTVSFVPAVSSLPAEYRRMAYIQTFGTSKSFIDTGVPATSDIRVDMAYQFIFTGARNDFNYLLDDNGSHNIVINGISSNQLKYTGLTLSGFTYPYDFKKHTIDVSQQRLVFDGDTYNNTTAEPAAWSSSKNIFLFGGTNAGTARNAPSRIYYCKIYSGNTPVRDLVPAQRVSDDKFGLYDKVNDVFYVAEGAMYGKASEPAYITDGLIAKFDGYDASSSNWADTYNSLFGVKLGADVAKTDDNLGVVFPNDYAGSTASPTNTSAKINAGSCTIEVVYKVDSVPSGNKILVKGYHNTTAPKGTFAFWIDAQGMVRNDLFTPAEVNNSVADYVGRIVTQSVTTTLNYVNGVSLGKGEVAGSTLSPGSTGAPLIGSLLAGTTQSYKFTGTIYMIRIYNRELTAAEIQHNQAIDMALYNISNS